MGNQRPNEKTLPPTEEREPYGGEVRLDPTPKPIGWLRWANYLLYLSAIIYLVVNRGQGFDALISLILMVLLAIWLSYFWSARRPPEL